MQNQIVVYLTILLHLSIGNQLSGQAEQRAPCGQDFFMQSMAISKHQVQPDLNYFSALHRYFGMNGHPRYGLGRTLVHETGHYFGLYHVWSNDPFCEEDDGVEDTPKQMHQHTGCPTHPQTSCTESDMFMNFMDYVDDPCMVMFTAGQKEKIWTNIYQFRSGLLNNTVRSYCINTKQKDDLVYIIAPNPVTDDVTITFPFQENGIFDIQIYDMLGRLHHNQSILGNGQVVISLQHLEAGIYLVRIGEKSQIFVKL